MNESNFAVVAFDRRRVLRLVTRRKELAKLTRRGQEGEEVLEKGNEEVREAIKEWKAARKNWL